MFFTRLQSRKETFVIPVAGVAVLFLLCVVCADRIPAAEAFPNITGLYSQQEDTYYLEQGKPVNDTWKTIGEKKYYFTSTGKAVKGTSKKIDGKYRVFDDNGVLSVKNTTHILRNKKASYLVKKDGSAVKKGWQTYKKHKCRVSKTGELSVGVKKIKKHYYYFNRKGYLAKGKKNRIITYNDTDYLVTKTGEMGRGWNKIGNYYCFCKKNGRLLKDTVKDKIRINEKGFAKTRPRTALEKKASAIVSSITNGKMSKAEKIAACWNYIINRSRYSSRPQCDPGAYSQSEFRRIALLMLNSHMGNCYGFAAGFAALTRAAGLDSYLIYGLCPGTRDRRADGLTRHGWVYISGYGYFDPEGQWAGFAHIYGSGSCPWIPQGRFAV